MNTDKRLFYGSCFALITTALSFSIRAGILPQLGEDLGLTNEQLGFINSMWFFGFPISMVVGGFIYYRIGGRIIMQFAFLTHALGIILTIYAGNYTTLLISTFLIGLGNGCTEAACNPMIADAFQGNKVSKMLNRFHMWFPGGIAMGSLISLFMNNYDVAWQSQIWLIMLPTLVYAYLFWGIAWPKTKTEDAGTISGNLSSMFTPLFLFILVCMWFTAQSEFAPTQWIELILKSSGATPMVILMLISGTMTISRYFGGDVVKKFNTTGVLLGSSLLAILGIFLFTQITGPFVYVVAVLYALGIAYFWPNMIGFVADYIPKSGALGMSVVGALGMLSSSVMQPIIGRWIDSNKAQGLANGLTGVELELFTGQGTLTTMMIFPGILIVLFSILYVWVGRKKSTA